MEDATVATQMLGLERKAVQELMSLPTGVAYVGVREWERPVRVGSPFHAMNKTPNPALPLMSTGVGLARRATAESHGLWRVCRAGKSPNSLSVVVGKTASSKFRCSEAETLKDGANGLPYETSAITHMTAFSCISSDLGEEFPKAMHGSIS